MLDVKIFKPRLSIVHYLFLVPSIGNAGYIKLKHWIDNYMTLILKNKSLNQIKSMISR